ncbi:MAG: conserved hypothetical protein [Candidatus Desulfovibrio kirbyi]|uniref:Uncharacterized protein n=1 Tax=Candidatus Desulfovibrio kirbyi TaxID=2696086 RepID=A0A6L2R4R8_9BACT|nr:MAG: conserved hypothetical protein [Candidatus Desulfovibrio kirbyi]
MSTDRKIFPVESLLALVTGKDGIDSKDIAGFIAGRSIACDCGAKAVGPFAASWLTRLYPGFAEMEWKEDQPWESFVSKAKGVLGDTVSLTPMDGRTKALVDATLDTLAQTIEDLHAQKLAATALTERVTILEPVEARADALQKKCDELETKIKAMNTEMGGFRKQIAEFQGKVAINHDELLQNIKSAIKDGLKGMVVGGVAADSGEAPAAEENAVPDDFGFCASGANNDGFGF